MRYKTYNIQVGPHTYQIRWEEDGDKDLDDAMAWGTTCAYTKTIRLRRDTDQARLLDTKLHEYIHAVEQTYGLDIPEEVVHILGTGLAQILKGRVDVEKI